MNVVDNVARFGTVFIVTKLKVLACVEIPIDDHIILQQLNLILFDLFNLLLFPNFVFYQKLVISYLFQAPFNLFGISISFFHFGIMN
jgi:hypothetical protein